MAPSRKGASRSPHLVPGGVLRHPPHGGLGVSPWIRGRRPRAVRLALVAGDGIETAGLVRSARARARARDVAEQGIMRSSSHHAWCEAGRCRWGIRNVMQCDGRARSEERAGRVARCMHAPACAHTCALSHARDPIGTHMSSRRCDRSCCVALWRASCTCASGMAGGFGEAPAEAPRRTFGNIDAKQAAQPIGPRH